MEKKSALNVKNLIMGTDEMTMAQMRQCNKALMDEVNTLRQSCKALTGIRSFELTKGVKVTTSAYAKKLGLASGKFEPKGVLDAWHSELKEVKDGVTTSYVCKKVPCHFMDGKKRCSVFVQTKDGDYEILSVFKAVEIEYNKWTANTILLGLAQGQHYEEVAKECQNSVASAHDHEKYYIRRGTLDKVARKMVYEYIEVKESAINF